MASFFSEMKVNTLFSFLALYFLQLYKNGCHQRCLPVNFETSHRTPPGNCFRQTSILPLKESVQSNFCEAWKWEDMVNRKESFSLKRRRSKHHEECNILVKKFCVDFYSLGILCKCGGVLCETRQLQTEIVKTNSGFSIASPTCTLI